MLIIPVHPTFIFTTTKSLHFRAKETWYIDAFVGNGRKYEPGNIRSKKNEKLKF
jgi:hypothetical protein